MCKEDSWNNGWFNGEIRKQIYVSFHSSRFSVVCSPVVLRTTFKVSKIPIVTDGHQQNDGIREKEIV